jgi:VanZ family protein
MKFYFRLPLALGWAVLILILTVTPLPAESNLAAEPFDKLAHVFIFAVFAILVAWALISIISLKRSLFTASVIGFLYSYLIEYWQQFIPGRSSSWGDFLAGTIGVLLASLLIYYAWRQKT